MQISLSQDDLRPLITEIVSEAVRQISLERSKPAEPMLLTIKQAAKLLNLSESSVYLETKAGRLKPVRVGTAVRYAPSDLQAWIDAERARTSPPTEVTK